MLTKFKFFVINHMSISLFKKMKNEEVTLVSTEKILERIARHVGVGEILEKLASLPSKDLQSLLLYVYERKARDYSILDVVNQYSQNRFVTPSAISQKDLILFDYLAYSVLPADFVGVELSPVAPFCTNRVLTATDQKKVMTTVRNVEVVADPTTVLALECARQRSELLRSGLRQNETIKLATSQRNVRLQNFEEIPGFTAHFGIFALTTAGRSIREEMSFERINLAKHVSFHLSLLELLNRHGFQFDKITVSFSDIRITESLIKQFGLDRKRLGRETQNPDFDFLKESGIPLSSFPSDLGSLREDRMRSLKIWYFIEALSRIEERVVLDLRERFPGVRFLYDLQRLAGIGYYTNFCFRITATNLNDARYPLVDGGFTDWTQKLLQSRKERLLISGIGSELLCQHFRT